MKKYLKIIKLIFKKILEFITSRLFIMVVGIAFLFAIMVVRLFQLQIVNGETYQEGITVSKVKSLKIEASRGEIYDRYGRPLAVNKVAYSIKIDNSIEVDTNYKNEMYMELIREIEKNGDEVIDNFPISQTRPYTFLFNGSENREYNWKKEAYLKGVKEDWTTAELKEYLSGITAEEVMRYMREELFKIPEELSDEDARKLIALRYAIYEQRYRQYQPITIATEVTDETVAVLEEKNQKYPGVYVEAQSLRVYPEGGLFSHILGYIRAISDDEYAVYKEYGYSSTDIVGKTGIEKSMELELNGTDGKMEVEVDNLGRRISIVNVEEAVQGNDIYLTLDRDLQEAAFKALEEELANVLLLKLDTSNTYDTRITLQELFSSMINANRFSIEDIWNSEENTYQYYAKQAILNQEPDFDMQKENALENAKQMICDAIQTGQLVPRQMVLIMHEQGLINLDEDTFLKVESGNIEPLDIIMQKIKEGEITPQDTALDPSTGSVTVTNVNTGEILAMVTYPTYDNNELVNTFNYDYYLEQQNDPTTPLINRPLLERKAPGSTFKMITALAGLETGTITEYEKIYDYTTFDKAGKPTASCWLTYSTHGYVDVRYSLEVSCNYFFYELAYRMGNTLNGNRLDSINTINKYASMFGLGSLTGVEIGEYSPQLSTPEYKESVIKSRNPDATASQTRWTDGDTIRTAIGQGYNNYSVTSMSKYIATLANGGTRYSSHLVKEVYNSDGTLKLKKEPIIEEQLDLKSENLKAVYEGMLAVTRGSRGTLRTQFADYPILVAGKSGTAQESSARNSHAWFVGFAPYDEPQISIAVMIPFGDCSKSAPAEVAKKVIYYYMGFDREAEIKTMENVLSR